MSLSDRVAVERTQLEGCVQCSTQLLKQLVPLLEKLGPRARHPGLMNENAIDSIGFNIDEARPELSRQRLLTGTDVSVVYKVRKYELLLWEACEKLPSARRRQCVAVLGTNEVARRLDVNERGNAEIVVSFPGGATLSVRKNKKECRMVVLLTSVQKKKKAIDADLLPEDVPKLAALFEEALKGGQQIAHRLSTASRLVKVESGAFWVLPPWYSEAIAVVAQDIFRLHVLVSSTSPDVSRSLFIDRVTAHRMVSGPIDTHRTLIKGILHRASGGCACLLHRDKPPVEKFQRLELRIECCGCTLVDGKCNRHYMAEMPTYSTKFPGVCMQGLKLELRCAHEFLKGGRGGVTIPLVVNDDTMDMLYSKPFLVDIAGCGCKLMNTGAEDEDARIDMNALLGELSDARVRNNQIGDLMMQRDVIAVYLLRNKTILTKAGKFAGKVAVDCNAILRTHKHLFKRSVS